jgi:3-hydroxybutyryl-CoA dehydratase
MEDIDVGHKESFVTMVSETKMGGYRDITGDLNPLHNDESFARKKGCDGRVVYGLLNASYFSTLVGMYLPGEKCLIQEVKYKFMKPAYIGDELVISGEVTEKDERTNQLFLKVRIERKSDKATIIRGTMTVGVLE